MSPLDNVDDVFHMHEYTFIIFFGVGSHQVKGFPGILEARSEEAGTDSDSEKEIHDQSDQEEAEDEDEEEAELSQGSKRKRVSSETEKQPPAKQASTFFFFLNTLSETSSTDVFIFPSSIQARDPGVLKKDQILYASYARVDARNSNLK